jgi:hypothetical protein
MFRRAVEIVDKVLNGANPVDVRVEQRNKIELLSIAKLRGCSASQSRRRCSRG